MCWMHDKEGVVRGAAGCVLCAGFAPEHKLELRAAGKGG